MSSTASVRLPDDLLREVEELAQSMHTGRSDVLREAIREGVKRKRIEHALDLYRRGEVSLGKAASIAGRPIGLFLDDMKEHGVLLNYDVEDLEEDIAWARNR